MSTKSKKIATVELVTPDTGLTKEQLIQAAELAGKYPQLEIAYRQVKQQEQTLRGKWFHFADTLRDAKLNSREMTLLLLSFGERKQRASEIIKVISVDDKVWAKYKAAVIGFKAVLAIARTPELAEGEAVAEEETKADDEKSKPVYRTLPDATRTAIHEALDAVKAELVPTGKGYYAFASLVTYNQHGRKFSVKIEGEDVAK